MQESVILKNHILKRECDCHHPPLVSVGKQMWWLELLDQGRDCGPESGSHMQHGNRAEAACWLSTVPSSKGCTSSFTMCPMACSSRNRCRVQYQGTPASLQTPCQQLRNGLGCDYWQGHPATCSSSQHPRTHACSHILMLGPVTAG